MKPNSSLSGPRKEYQGYIAILKPAKQREGKKVSFKLQAEFHRVRYLSKNKKLCRNYL